MRVRQLNIGTLGLTVALLFFAVRSSAQTATVTFTPPNPNESNRITGLITFQYLSCTYLPTTTVTGTTVRTTIAVIGCVLGPPPGNLTLPASFGPLPAGTYTYEVYFQHGSGPPPVLGGQRPLVVLAMPAPGVPTVSAVMSMLLIVAVAGLGLRILGRS